MKKYFEKNCLIGAISAAVLFSCSAYAGTIPVSYTTTSDSTQTAPASIVVNYRTSDLSGHYGYTGMLPVKLNQTGVITTNDNVIPGQEIPNFGIKIDSISENGQTRQIMNGNCFATDGTEAGPANTVTLVREQYSNKTIGYTCQVSNTK